jgi:LPXTG-motif cell wall-anchored protein
MAAAVGAIPLAGFLLTAAAALLFSRSRRRDQEKYKGLRVLR